jgi:hypothetical protein
MMMARVKGKWNLTGILTQKATERGIDCLKVIEMVKYCY